MSTEYWHSAIRIVRLYILHIIRYFGIFINRFKRTYIKKKNGIRYTSIFTKLIKSDGTLRTINRFRQIIHQMITMISTLGCIVIATVLKDYNLSLATKILSINSKCFLQHWIVRSFRTMVDSAYNFNDLR